MVEEIYDGPAFPMCLDHLKLIFHGLGWDTSYVLNLEVAKLQHVIEAHIDLKTWKVHVKVDERILSRLQKLVKEHSLQGVLEEDHLIFRFQEELDVLEREYALEENFHALLHDFLAGIAYHEFGHSKECPVDARSFSEILLAVNTALEQDGRQNDQLLYYIINLFTDLVINTIFGLPAENSFYRNSFFLFHFSEMTLGGDSDLPFIYFVLLNSKLYQYNPPMVAKLESLAIPSLGKGYEGTLRKLVEIFAPQKSISSKLMGNEPLEEDEAWELIEMLSDREAWPARAYWFARILMQILPEGEKIRFHVSDTAFIKEFKENQEFRDEVYDFIIEKKIQDRSKQQQDKSLKSPKTVEKDAEDDEETTEHDEKDALAEGADMDAEFDIPSPDENQEDQPSAGGDLKQDPYREEYPGEDDPHVGLEAFLTNAFYSSMYKKKLKDISIDMGSTGRLQKFPITNLGSKIMDERDDPMSIDPMFTFFLPGKKDDMLLFSKQHQLMGDVPVETPGTFYPDIALLLDDSGSMCRSWDFRTMEGKYDKLILTIFSLISWFSTQPFAPVIEYNLSLFSSTTRSTGWIDFYHLEQLLPILFSPEGGSTYLEKSVLKDILMHEGQKAIILITDGEISNQEDVWKLLDEYKHNLLFFMIQIGSTSKLARRVRKMGFPVVMVEDTDDLSGLVLDFTNGIYDRNR